MTVSLTVDGAFLLDRFLDCIVKNGGGEAINRAKGQLYFLALLQSYVFFHSMKTHATGTNIEYGVQVVEEQ